MDSKDNFSAKVRFERGQKYFPFAVFVVFVLTLLFVKESWFPKLLSHVPSESFVV
jgi:hypothetical protein